MKRFAWPLTLVFACHSRGDPRFQVDLGADQPEVGFGERFQVEARSDRDGAITWTQVSGPKLLEATTSDRGFRFSAKMPDLATMLSDGVPWGIVPVSPRTRAEAVLEADWRPTRGGAPVRRSIRVAAAARSRGLPNVPIGQRIYLGGAGWRVTAGPASAVATVRDVGGVSTFTPDQEGVFTLSDAAERILRVQAGRYDETPLDCGRGGCHGDISAAIERSPMTLALARLLERPDLAPDGVACALACHATGEPGIHDGGFVDVATELGSSATLEGVAELSSLPRDLRRLGGVGCLACHGPSALPEASARWSVLRSDLCAYCHDAPARYGHVAGWRASQMAHADRDPEARSRAECVACHTTWGFLERVSAPTPERRAARRPPDGTGTIGIACAACHDAHAGETTTRQRGLLRAIPLSEMFDQVPEPARSTSGACLACHAPDSLVSGRTGSPPADDRGLVLASAAAIWAGRGGVDPETGKSLDGPAPHLGVAGGCVGCHADGPAGLEAGAGHAFKALRSRCDVCHRDRVPEPSSPTLQAEARELWEKLIERGVVEGGTKSDAPRPLHATAKPGTDRRAPLARAAFDLLLVLEDPAAYAHNLPYAERLVETSRKVMARTLR